MGIVWCWRAVGGGQQQDGRADRPSRGDEGRLPPPPPFASAWRPGRAILLLAPVCPAWCGYGCPQEHCASHSSLFQVEYGQFLEVVALHKRTLELTIDNAETSVLCLGLVEQIMHNISVKLRDWFDKCQQEMYSLRIMVHREHLGYFRETYLCIGDLLYKKEKKIEEIDRQLRLEHIQLEFCIETFDLSAKRHSEAKKELMKIREATAEEIEMLKGKVGQAMEDFLESEEALKIEGLDFMHPAEEFQYLVMNQREKINLYKAHFNKEEEVRIVAEREEIRRLVALTPVKNQWGSSPEAIPRPLEFAAE